MIDENVLEVDGEDLTIDDVAAVAFGQPSAPRLVLSERAISRIDRAARAVAELVERGEVAYGITTGFGAFKDRIIPHDEVNQLQQNIVLSHAVGTGDPFDVPTTRAIMLIRANTLARGCSGIRSATVQRLIDLLNYGIHPIIPEKGSLGASGDLAPLAHMALVMIGEGRARVDDEILTGAEALARFDLAPVKLTAKEGLALTNGTAVMCALGALHTVMAERLIQTADLVGCLTLEALHGTPLAYDRRIHSLRPLPRQIECATYLRRVLEGSQFTRAYDPTDIQDAYSLRCIPQVHGAVRDAVAYLRWMIEIELNSVTDNPLVLIDDEDRVEIVSGGNFHGEPLALALDYLSIAITELGNMSERRLFRLVDSASNKGLLPAFLIPHGGINSGFMIVQYTAAALATENKVLSHPASVDTIPTSANVEDHVSMGVTAGLHARQILDNVTGILSFELLGAAQAVDFRKEALPAGAQMGRGTQPIYDLVRAHVPFVNEDCYLYPHMETVRQLVRDGVVVDVANQVLDAAHTSP